MEICELRKIKIDKIILSDFCFIFLLILLFLMARESLKCRNFILLQIYPNHSLIS